VAKRARHSRKVERVQKRHRAVKSNTRTRGLPPRGRLGTLGIEMENEVQTKKY
jgi:hypothetical protein